LEFYCRIPVIGGRELDLHRLFVEVTSRGGFEKVRCDYNFNFVSQTLCEYVDTDNVQNIGHRGTHTV